MSDDQNDPSNFSNGANCYFDIHLFADESSAYNVNHCYHHTNMHSTQDVDNQV